jgi:hypothetical protein
MSKSAVFARKAFFSNLKMLEKCVESAHKILLCTMEWYKPFLVCWVRHQANPLRQAWQYGINGLGARPFHNTLRSQKFMFKRDFGHCEQVYDHHH